MKLSRLAGAVAALALVALALWQPGCATPEEERKESLVDLRAYLRDDVADPERSKRALGILDELDRQTEELAGLRTAFRADLKKLNEDYGSSDEALIARAAEYRQARAATRGGVIKSRTAMREALAADEWAGYAEREAKLFESTAKQGGDL